MRLYRCDKYERVSDTLKFNERLYKFGNYTRYEALKLHNCLHRFRNYNICNAFKLHNRVHRLRNYTRGTQTRNSVHQNYTTVYTDMGSIHEAAKLHNRQTVGKIMETLNSAFAENLSFDKSQIKHVSVIDYYFAEL